MKEWFRQPVHDINQDFIKQAKSYQETLTKPLGSLGRLETIAEQFAGWQSTLHPKLNTIQVVVFAGDHGVCAQGVSAFPQEVTVQMMMNFLNGGAAISVLSREFTSDFVVVNMGAASVIPDSCLQYSHFINADIAPGTADLSLEPAMTEVQLNKALEVGRYQIENNRAELFVGGEMGIGNTTSASAICAAILGVAPDKVVGSGTGVNAAGLLRKEEVIAKALKHHNEILNNPYQILRCLGGLEIAGLVGSYIACAQRGIPVLVDGFICTAAALLATYLNEGTREWLLFAHESAEPGHALALQHLNAKPLLQLGLRLGEGSGAAIAVPLLKSAVALHNGMTTFAQAGVSNS